jgi:long-subunit acyl-CoA synthetase (AMP-forming)
MESKLHASFDGLMYSFSNYGDRIAATDKNGNNYSYHQFYNHSGWSRKKLQKKGVIKGTKVLLAIPMSMQLYVTMEALFSLGAVIIFLDPWMNGKQMGKIIRRVEPELFITTPKIRFFAYFSSAARSIKKWWSFSAMKADDEKWVPIDVTNQDQALVTFTSGTSGEPKGADRDFGFLAAQIQALKPHMQTQEDEIFIDYTNFPIVGLADFAMGNHLIIPNINLMKIDKADLLSIKNSFKKKQVNRVIVSPALLLKIEQLMAETGNTFNLKHIITGGAPIPFSLIKKINKAYPHLAAEGIFGSTEAEPIAISSFKEVEKMMGNDPLCGIYVGEFVPEIELKIIKSSLESVDAHKMKTTMCNEGENGEVIVCGEHVNKKYYKNKKAFKENKITDNKGRIWHRTGDVGYLKQSKLYLTGRVHRIVQKNNKQFYPYPIEFYLDRKLNIKDCGYLQIANGEVVLFIGEKCEATDNQIFLLVKETDYPLDRIYRLNKLLPRDPRHRTKLDTKPLLELYL